MTSKQARRLGCSDRALEVVKRIRRLELAQSGRPVRGADVASRQADWWSLSSLLRLGLIVVGEDGAIRTAGAARQMSGSWLA